MRQDVALAGLGLLIWSFPAATTHAQSASSRRRVALSPYPLLIALLSMGLIPLRHATAADPASPPPQFHVGLRVLDFPRANAALRAGKKDPPPVTVAIWYPTAAPMSPHKYNDPLNTTTEVALESSPTPGPHPLVVFSHGYGGAGIASIYLTEYLARQGFIVAAPDHEDHNVIERTKPGRPLKESWYSYNVIKLARSGHHFDHKAQAHRSTDVRQVIDELLKLNNTDGSPFKGAINPDAIGVMGHSLGGYTALRVCGLSQADYDPRIKVALLLTGGVYMFRAEDYRRLHVPVMFMFGEVETAHWRTLLLNDKLADTSRAYKNCSPPKYMFEIKQGNHFSFSQAVFDKKWPGLGPKAPPVVDIIKKYSLAFLRRWLLNDQTADAVLDVRDPLFLLYEKQVPQTETGNPKPEVQNPRRSRMIIDQLKNASLYRQMSPKLAVAFDFLQKTDFSRLAPGRYEIDGPSVYATVLQYETKPMDQCSWEAHRKYIDVQYIVEGTERMGHANVQDLTPSQPYDEAQDFLKLQGTGNFFVVGPGTFLVFTPQDAHMPGIAVTNPQPVRKVVVKVLAP